MAMAYLCSQVQKKQYNASDWQGPPLRFRAFVVDHKVREESAEEAKLTARRLRQIGIPTTTLRGSARDDPHHTAALEPSLRRIRFRLLGRACRCFKIDSLLLAHHADDQAETVLMRITQGHVRSTSLRGIGSAVNIPDTSGLHGVRESGELYGPKEVPEFVVGSLRAECSSENGIRSSSTRGPRNVNSGAPDPGDTPDSLGEADPPCHAADDSFEVPIAKGGVWLYRPCLDFSKDQLRSTCEHSGTLWAEDPTNENLALTPRNTIRSLLKNDRLPRALRPDRLLSIAKACRKGLEQRDPLIDTAFEMLENKRLDVRTGTFSFTLPSASSLSRQPFPPDHHPGVDLGLAKRILQLIMAVDRVSPRQLSPLAAVLHADIAQAETSKTPGFTTATIRCEQVSSGDQHIFSQQHWFLSRQPSPRIEVQPSYMNCTWRRPTTTSSDHSDVGVPFWTWQLWDFRYWLRAADDKFPTLTVRFLRKSDLARLYETTDLAARAKIRKSLPPGNVRYTLPVLVEYDDGPVLAFPTLGYTVSTAVNSLKWEVQYKSIQSVFGGLSPAW